ncbi:putative thiamine pyrophosphokinase [Aspergillus unguis]
MEWDPTQFFREDENISPHPYALIVLNQPINETALAVLRKHARMTVCADGGANRFYEWAKTDGKESVDLPTTIIGDLDSIRPSVRTHYKDLGVNIVQDDDQYSTDFTKSLKYIRSESTGQDLSILILGGLGGRVDQAFSQIHHLYMMNQAQSQLEGSGNLYLVSEESITFILQPGENTIHVPRTNRPDMKQDNEKETDYLLEENVGIIPLSGPARISTKGFEWDVEDWKTEIGGQISTSNHIRAETVKVSSGVPVLFTVELARRLKRVSR